MKHKDRIAYSTEWKNASQRSVNTGREEQAETVTIDYDLTLQLFLTRQDRSEFSPKKMLEMVNGWVKVNAARVTTTKRLCITTRDATCELTPKALNALSHQYYRNVHWWDELPHVSKVLSENYTVVVSL